VHAVADAEDVRIAVAAARWQEIDGALARQGVDPLRLPLPRLLNLIWLWVAERMDAEHLDEWDRELNASIRRVSSDKVSQAEVDEEMDLFQQAQGVLR
jgi:hypothetical protein